MATWQPHPRTRRIVLVSIWTFILGVPVLALFYPDLWKVYFEVLVLGTVCMLPFLRGHLFRLKTDETSFSSPPQAIPPRPDHHTGTPATPDSRDRQPGG